VRGSIQIQSELSAVLASAFVASALFSQAAQINKPSFDLASVKVNNSGGNFGGITGVQNNRFTAKSATLTALAQFAYYRPIDQKLQVFGMPSWGESEHFDIEAKSEGEPRRIALDEMRVMVQSLLEERFHLKAHRETRDLAVYTLVVGKNGTKLKPSTEENQSITAPSTPSEETGVIQSPFGSIGGRGANRRPPTVRGASISREGSDLVATHVDMTFFVNFLSLQLSRAVIDETGLKGVFDFRLHYTVDPSAYLGGAPAGPAITQPGASDPSGPSIFTAVEDVGLRLESSKASVEVLVIDSVERPKEN
jgi:uncharacterized protein (TIGR03435 family)